MTQLRRYYGGAIFSPPDHRDLLYAAHRTLAAANPNNDLTHLDDGTIWNQAHEGSCTAWSLTDIVEAVLRTQGGAPRERLSAAHQYYNARQFEDHSFPQDAGCSMRGAAQAMVDYGCCYESLWPYIGDGSQVDDTPPAEAVAAQGQHKILTYVRIDGTGQALLNNMLAAMNDGHPVWIAFNVYPSFESVGRNGLIPMRQSGDYVLGGHAVGLWGSAADNSFAGGGSFDLKNQWSLAWGNNGRARMPFGYVIDGTVVEAWIIRSVAWADAPAPPDPEPVVPVWQGYLDDVDGIHDEGQRLIAVAQQEFEDAQNENRPVAHGVMNGAVGPLWNYLDQLQADAHSLASYIPKVDPPPVPTGLISGVAVSYGGGTANPHDPARDVYGGYTDDQVRWGPHHGLPFIAPADGVVTLYSFPTPLSAAVGTGKVQGVSPIDEAAYQLNHDALFGGDFICGMPVEDLRRYGQTMYFIVYQPDVAIPTSYGLFRVGWAGHSRGNAKVGRVRKGEQYGESWDTGIHFEPGVPEARAAHVHAAASATGALTMNGDINGLAWCEVHGWKVAFTGGNGPGPDQYLGGQYCAGRLLSDFRAAGRQPPPMPG